MRRSLIYHIFPHGDYDILYDNLVYISSFDNNFDYIIYKVVTNDEQEAKKILDPFLKRANNRTVVNYYPNNPLLGEVVGFIDSLNTILNIFPDGITYVGTTAGVSKPSDPYKKNIYAWARSIYLMSLSNIPKIENLFYYGYQAVGCYKKNDLMDKGGPRPAPWHYSGGQFWISNQALINTNWKDIANCRHGVEMYPGYMISSDKAYCLFNTGLDLYNNTLPSSSWIPNIR